MSLDARLRSVSSKCDKPTFFGRGVGIETLWRTRRAGRCGRATVQRGPHVAMTAAEVSHDRDACCGQRGQSCGVKAPTQSEGRGKPRIGSAAWFHRHFFAARLPRRARFHVRPRTFRPQPIRATSCQSPKRERATSSPNSTKLKQSLSAKP